LNMYMYIYFIIIITHIFSTCILTILWFFRRLNVLSIFFTYSQELTEASSCDRFTADTKCIVTFLKCPWYFPYGTMVWIRSTHCFVLLHTVFVLRLKPHLSHIRIGLCLLQFNTYMKSFIAKCYPWFLQFLRKKVEMPRNPDILTLYRKIYSSIALETFNVPPLSFCSWENHQCEKHGNTQISPNLSHKLWKRLAPGMPGRSYQTKPGCQVNIKCFYAKCTCLGSNNRNISSLTLVQKVIPGYLQRTVDNYSRACLWLISHDLSHGVPLMFYILAL
jgi:hypothetical protein